MTAVAAGACLVVALTGGIASGKSAAAAQFAACGVPVFDADVIARQLVAPRTEALAEIAAAFGATMLRADGSLDRGAMRERVFADAAARRKLEAILHPRVRRALTDAAQTCASAYCLLVIPLLTELFAQYRFVDRVLVLDVSPAVQMARLMARDSATIQAAQQIIAVQVPRARRLAIADDAIDNDGDPAMLARRLERLQRIYLAAAQGRATVDRG